jgi:hypothetical protein
MSGPNILIGLQDVMTHRERRTLTKMCDVCFTEYALPPGRGTFSNFYILPQRFLLPYLALGNFILKLSVLRKRWGFKRQDILFA